MTVAAARTVINKAHQFLDGMGAVAANSSGLAFSDRNHPPTDDEHAVVPAGEVFLDDDAAAECFGAVKRRMEFLAGADIGTHAAAMIGIKGLDHHWPPDCLGCEDCLFEVLHQFAARNRNANLRQ